MLTKCLAAALGLTRVCRSTLALALKVDVEHNVLPGTGLPPSKQGCQGKRSRKKRPGDGR